MDAGPGLLFVQLMALHIVLQARSIFVGLRASRIARVGVQHAQGDVIRPGQVGYAGAHSCGRVVRKQQRHQQERQKSHPPESHLIPRFESLREIGENAVA